MIYTSLYNDFIKKDNIVQNMYFNLKDLFLVLQQDYLNTVLGLRSFPLLLKISSTLRHTFSKHQISKHVPSSIKKAQQRNQLPVELEMHENATSLCTFYRGTIESILTKHITAWFGSFSSSECQSLECLIKTAKRIARTTLPSPPNIYNDHCVQWSGVHPTPFALPLLHCMRLCSLKATILNV